jgi:zinc/manganese transport system substrate-binding protein
MSCPFPLALLAAVLSVMPLVAAEPLRICATVPDLGDLARQVGGDQVAVTVFCRGGDDPHFVEARPSFSTALSRADLLLVVGLELEIGWVPVLQEQARNPRVLTGGTGHFDASTVVDKLGIPSPDTDRSHGDVHAGGNPHYLSDPRNGLLVARALRDRLSTLDPSRRERFHANWRTFSTRLAVALFGDAIGRALDPEEIPARIVQETASTSTDSGGWFAELREVRGSAVIADHDLWPYLAHRFGFTVVGFLEPKPGIPPTTAHLAALIEHMRRTNARAILTVPYFQPRHARLVAERTGAQIVPLAHQVGALPGADDYLALIAHNVAALRRGLRPGP